MGNKAESCVFKFPLMHFAIRSWEQWGKVSSEQRLRALSLASYPACEEKVAGCAHFFFTGGVARGRERVESLFRGDVPIRSC